MSNTSTNRVHINLTISPLILNWIDTIRGQEPRSTFINRILSKICSQTQKAFNWEEEELAADEDIKKGRLHRFKTARDAIRWLRS